MASKATGSRKLKKSLLPKFEAELYTKIPQGELIVFAVQYLIEQKIETTLDDVVSACFLLFPHKFSLKKYPKWPDSALVGRRWGISRKKKYVTASADFEYRLTVKGQRLIKKVSKKLRVVTPKPVQPKKATIKKIQKIPVAVQIEEAKPSAPIKKIPTVRVRKASPVAGPVKQVQAVSPSIQVRKKKPVHKEKVIQLDLIKVEPVQAKKEIPAPVKQVETQVKKKQVVHDPEPARKVKPIQAKKTQPVIVLPVKDLVEKARPAAPSPITKEAKERAWKFTRLMEKSDAYIHYKKNGSKAYINEFDFRSLLLCTMESSAETLARNVELFKGYAGIHNRQDLILFLNYCEDKFSHLLKPQSKPVKKKK